MGGAVADSSAPSYLRRLDQRSVAEPDGRSRPAPGDGPAWSGYGVTVTPGAISAVPLVSFPEPVAPSELTKRS